MAPNPYDKYSNSQKAQPAPAGASSRDTDARALLACARRLNDARLSMQANPSRENLKLYNEAVRHNQRLWTIFQVALADPLNPLPENLKLILLNLSRYIDKTSFRVISKPEPVLIDSLIGINRAIAAGLSKQPENGVFEAPIDTREIPTSLMTSA